VRVLTYTLVFIAVILVALWMLANRNERRYEAATPPSGQFITVDGHKIHVQISGNGPPLVMIHGASGNLLDLTYRLAPAVTDRFTVIAFDRPGLGYSPTFNGKGETLQEQAQVLASATRALGYDKVYVLGQSYGGSVALRWTLDEPEMVAGLVLVAAPSNNWDSPLGSLYAITANHWTGPLMRLLIGSVTPASVVKKSLIGVFEPQAVPDGYGDYIGTGLSLRRGQQRANALQVRALKEQVNLMAPRYGEITIPVEAIHGTADTIVPKHIHSDILAGQISDITVTTLDGIGHMPHQTNFADVVALIDRLHAKVGLNIPE
jgi:pimeloyl-ACP methyl ester carboxylesterase